MRNVLIFFLCLLLLSGCAPAESAGEGYTFTGWHTDTACLVLWNVEERPIETDMTLYAGWEKIE